MNSKSSEYFLCDQRTPQSIESDGVHHRSTPVSPPASAAAHVRALKSPATAPSLEAGPTTRGGRQGGPWAALPARPWAATGLPFATPKAGAISAHLPNSMRIPSNSGPCGRTQGAAGNPPRWPGTGGSRKGNNNKNLNICILNFTTSRKIVLPQSAKIKAILFLV